LPKAPSYNELRCLDFRVAEVVLCDLFITLSEIPEIGICIDGKACYYHQLFQ